MPAGSRDQAAVLYQGISKSYDRRTFAIENFDMEVRPGEFLTMLGPSGSGKTTLLMMLAGFEAPTSGQLVVNGRPVQDTPPHRRNIGVVFQSYALFPHLTVAENLAYPLKIRRMARAQIAARVARALDMVQLGGYGDRFPMQLSGGQQQRVAVARALIYDPDLVLMDEPLGALDKMMREEMQHELKKLHMKLGVTVLYVTHDQTEAIVMSDRVAILRGGKLQQIAPPKTLYEQPDNAFVATFIGESNSLAGTVRSRSGETCAIDLPGCGTALCRAGSALREGDAATVMIRPERIRVGKADGGEAGGENRFPAIVTDFSFYGDSYRLELQLASGAPLYVKLPNTSRFDTFDRGEAVVVEWLCPEAIAFAS